MYVGTKLLTTDSQVSILWNLKLVGSRHETHLQLDRAWEEQKGEDRRQTDEHWTGNQSAYQSIIIKDLRPPHSRPCCSALTSLRQDGGPMDGDVLKVYRSYFHDNPQTSQQGTPRQHQVTRCRVKDTPINAVSSQVVVCRLWINVCCWSNEMRKHCLTIFLIWHKRGVFRPGF